MDGIIRNHTGWGRKVIYEHEDEIHLEPGEALFDMHGLQIKESGEEMPEVLPTDAAARKEIPIATGFLDYFPRAIAEVAKVSQVGNEQHNPGQPLRWDRSKSGDEADAAMRHFLQRGTRDADGCLHSAKWAWRAFALLEKELESME